ncbi:hypothetical protein ACP70R_031570 [Stipagrostis hirtigluma subsp. patula]
MGGACSSFAIAADIEGKGSTEVVMQVVSRLRKSGLVKGRDRLYLLFRVDEGFGKVLLESSEVDPIYRLRVHKALSENGAAMVELHDVPKLNHFPGWSGEDIQEELEKLKITKVSILIYCEKEGALVRLSTQLRLTYLCLTGDTERRCHLKLPTTWIYGDDS